MNDTQLFVDLCLAKMASRRGGSVVAENKAAGAIYRRFGMVRSVMADAAKLAAIGAMTSTVAALLRKGVTAMAVTRIRPSAAQAGSPSAAP